MAQILEENEESYVHFYIQSQSIGTAYETLLTLQQLERGQNGGQRTTAESGNYSNAELSIKPLWPGPMQCDVI